MDKFININNYEHHNRKIVNIHLLLFIYYYILDKRLFYLVHILISRNHSITHLISFPKKVKKQPCSEINAFMNWDPGIETETK
jgi:hypothetical protein